MSEKKRGLRAFLFDHLLSKLLALALALVTVYLIEQELSGEVEWVGPSRRVPVLLSGERWAGDPGAPRIVLRPDPGVVVTDRQPAAIKIRIQGAANRLDDFAAAPVIYVDVKREWTSERVEVATRVITESDFELYDKNVEITLTEALKVEVDLEETRTVPATVKSPPESTIPRGFLFDSAATVVEPSEVEVRGPRSMLAALGPESPIELDLRDAGSYSDGDRVPLVPPTTWRLLSLERRGPLTAVVRLTEEKLETLDLGEMDVLWSISNRNLGELQTGDLKLENIGAIRQRARVFLKGAPAVVAAYRSEEQKAALRQSISVLADPTRVIENVIADEASRTIPVAVFGLPPGLSKLRIEPDSVSLKIIRK